MRQQIFLFAFPCELFAESRGYPGGRLLQVLGIHFGQRANLMLALHILRWLLSGAELIIALPVLYLGIVSASAILAVKRRKNGPGLRSPRSPLTHFAILIPAHNES